VDSELLGIIRGDGLGDAPYLIDEDESFDLKLLDVVDLFKSYHEHTWLGPVEHIYFLDIICEKN
jgi:hypothetical protein